MSHSQGHPDHDTSFTQNDLLGLWFCYLPKNHPYQRLPTHTSQTPWISSLGQCYRPKAQRNFPHLMDMVTLISSPSSEGTSSLYPLPIYAPCWQLLFWTVYDISSLFIILRLQQRTKMLTQKDICRYAGTGGSWAQPIPQAQWDTPKLV